MSPGLGCPLDALYLVLCYSSLLDTLERGVEWASSSVQSKVDIVTQQHMGVYFHEGHLVGLVSAIGICPCLSIFLAHPTTCSCSLPA